MRSQSKKKELAIAELATLQRQIADLEEKAIECQRVFDALQVSETRYRSLFETAQDGILILNAETGRIEDVNPFLAALLGYTHGELLGNRLWEIGPFKNVIASQDAFLELQEKGYIRYAELPLETKDGKSIAVEFVSNVYQVARKKVIQCNIRDITGRRSAEKLFQKSEIKYRKLYESMMDGFVFVGMDGGIKEYNETYREMLGYSPEELLKLTYRDLTPEKWHAFEQTIVDEEILVQGYSRVYEKEYRKNDGTIFPVELRTFLLKDETGNVAGMWAIVRDITVRKRVDGALRQSEEKFATAFHRSPIAMSISTLNEGRYLDVNDELLKMSEWTREEMIGHTGFELGIWVDPNQRSAILDRLREQRPVHNEEHHIRTKRGKVLTVLLSYEKISVNNEPCLLASGIDITEQKRAEESLAKSEARYRLLVEVSPLMILLHQRKKYVYANPAAMKALGASRAEEVIGKSIYEFIHPDSQDLVNKRIEKLEKGGTETPIEQRYIRLDKKVIDVEVVHAQSLYQDEGLILAIGFDITEQKKAEKEKAALQAQFYQAQKMEAIGQLASGFAHDFNNSLTLISVCSQLALMSLEKEHPVREKVETIYAAIERAANLARQLLAFSRRQIMEMKVFDLNSLLRDLDRMAHRVIGENIDLTLDLSSELGTVKADPGQIEQVIVNLIVNARDAMPDGGHITIKTENIELGEDSTRVHPEIIPGDYVSINVADGGTGMPPEVQARVFEPFFTTKEKGKGTGLGLSSAYGIVKQSGGYIYVESELGQGTTFRIYLPRMKETPVPRKIDPSEQNLPRGGESILVVEDEKQLRDFVVEILLRQGYKVLKASNGGEAFFMCEKNGEPVNLMITDVVMPGMSGRELADRLQVLRPEMRVLYMSGYSYDEISHHGVLLEGIDFIQKPFTVEGLAARVRKMLDQEKTNDSFQPELRGLDINKDKQGKRRP